MSCSEKKNFREELRSRGLYPKDSPSSDELIRLESEYQLAASTAESEVHSIWMTQEQHASRKAKSAARFAAAKQALESATLPECYSRYEIQYVPPFFHYKEEEQEDIVMPTPSWIQCEFWIKDKIHSMDKEMLVPILAALSNKAHDEINAKIKKIRAPVPYGESSELERQHSLMDKMARNIQYKHRKLVRKIINFNQKKR